MKTIVDYLEEQTAFWTAEGRKLTADDRRDEGNLTKIRANVYGICATVLRAVGMEKGGERILGLRDTWETALIAARTHHDAEKVLVEEVKLEVIGDVLKKLNEV